MGGVPIWKKNYENLENYLEETACNVTLFDVSLHMNFSKASKSGIVTI